MKKAVETVCVWRISECGWPTYFREVAELTRGRMDVQILCHRPGTLVLVEKE